MKRWHWTAIFKTVLGTQGTLDGYLFAEDHARAVQAATDRLPSFTQASLLRLEASETALRAPA